MMMVLTPTFFTVALINLIGCVGGHGDVINIQGDVGGTPRARHHRVYLGGDLVVGWAGNGSLGDRLVILEVFGSIP